MQNRETPNPIEEIGEQYLQQLRAGKNPQFEDFTIRLEGKENEIRDFLKALAIVDRCKSGFKNHEVD